MDNNVFNYIGSKLNDFKNSVAQNAGNFVGGAAQNVGNYFNPTSNGGNNFWHTPIAQGLANTQHFLDSPKPFNIPQINLPKPIEDIPVLGGLAHMGVNIPGGIINSGLDLTENSLLDTARIAGHAIGGTSIPTYDQLSSPITKLGYNAFGQRATPQEVLGNIGELGSDIFNVSSLGGAKIAGNIAKEGLENATKQTFLNAVKQGAITGAKGGALFGFLQGLSDNRKANSVPGQLFGALGSGLQGGAMGGIFGGTAGGVGYTFGAIKNKLSQALQNNHPEMSSEQADKAVSDFARDELGRFKGKKAPNEPMYYQDLREQLGLPPDGNYERGFVDVDELTGKGSSSPSQTVKLYRGSGNTTGAEGFNAYGEGDYYSTSPKYASQYGEVSSSNVKFDNPFVINSQEDLQSASNQMVKDGFTDIGKWAQSKGFDGIIDKVGETAVKFSTPVPSNLLIQSPEIGRALKSSGSYDEFSQKMNDAGVYDKLSDQAKQLGYSSLFDYFNKSKGVTPLGINTGSVDTTEYTNKYGQAVQTPLVNGDVNETNQAAYLKQPSKSLGDIGDILNNEQPITEVKGGKTVLTDAGKQKVAKILRTGPDDPFIKGLQEDAAALDSNGVEPATQYTQTKIGDTEGGLSPQGNINQKTDLSSQGIISKENVPERNILPSDNNPIDNTIKGLDIKQVRSKAFATNQVVDQMASVLQNQVERLESANPENTQLIRQTLEHPETLDKNALASGDAKLFESVIDQFQKFTDFVHSAKVENGSDAGYIEKYYPHLFDLTDPEKAAQYEQLLSKAKNIDPFYNKPRIFSTLDEAQAAGFEPKNATVGQDIADYTNLAKKELQNNILVNEIEKKYPNKIYTTDSGEAPPSNFIQLKIPGSKGTYVSPDLYQKLSDLEPANFTTPVKVLDKINSGIKMTDLSGGGFHIINTMQDYLGTNLSYLKAPRLVKMAQVFFSPDAMADYRQELLDQGIVQDASKMNVTLSSTNDFGSGEATALDKVKDTISKYNPLAKLNRATFQRLEDFFKLETVRLLKENGVVDLSSPEGLKEAQDVGSQINNIFGGQNRIVGDSIFKSKIGQFLSRLAFLAPDYQEGRFKRTISAAGGVVNPTTGNAFALRSLVGRLMVTGVLAEVGKKLFTGKFSGDIVNAIKNDFFDPNFQSPYDNNKKKQLVHLPASNLSDVTRLVSDPLNEVPRFLSSHLGALPANAVKFISNKDYFGNPLSEDNDTIEKVKNLVASNLPIPAVQAQKVFSGKENPGNAMINILGGRVSTDPNDPTMKYFKSLADAGKGLNANEQKIFYGIIHPTSKDQNGNAIVDKNLYTTPAKYEALLANPKLLAVEQQFQKSQPNHDPLWDLNSNQLRAYLQAQVISKNDPGGDSKTTQALYSILPANFNQQRKVFFNQLLQSGQVQPQPSNGKPQVSDAMQSKLDYYNTLPQRTGARSRFLVNNPDVLQYFNDSKNYTNAQRADMGLPLLDSSGGGSGYGGYSYAQKKLMYNIRKPVRKARIPKIKMAKLGRIKTRKSRIRFPTAKAFKV